MLSLSVGPCVLPKPLPRLLPDACLPLPALPPCSCHLAAATVLQGEKAAQNFLSEAVVRSLPKGLSLEQRQQVVASTPLSPTLNLLSSMPLVRRTAVCPCPRHVDT